MLRGVLLGGATALIGGVSITNATVADPEPAGYMRACDVYGAGFFLMPETVTCVQISGHVWYQVGSEGFRDGGDTPDRFAYGSFPGSESFVASAIARVNFEARSDTELGTLRSYVRFESDFIGYNTADGSIGVDEAFVDFGALRFGYTESAWLASQQAGFAQYGSHSWSGMYYGSQQRDLVAYTIGSESGLAATVSLEDDGQQGGNYIPDVVGVVTYNRPWGAVWAKAGLDEDRGDTGDSGYALQAGLHYNLTRFGGSSVRMIGTYADSDNDYGTGHTYSHFAGGHGNSEWSVLASYLQRVTQDFSGSVALQYFDNFYEDGSSDAKSGLDGYGAEFSLVWLPVTNLEVRTELHYDKIDTLDGTTSGYLRFTRFF